MNGPIMLSTWSFGQKANHAGWPYLTQGAGSPLDAVEHACRLIESDEGNLSVGKGGLPDRSGQTTLDASIMLSPARCGSVAYVRRFEHPVSIARQVMEKTPHVMLVGDGADRFAKLSGMTPTDLSTEKSRAAWRKWIEQHPDAAADNEKSYLPPANIEEQHPGSSDPLNTAPQIAPPTGSDDPTPKPSLDILRAEDLAHNRTHDTVGVLAMNEAGVLGGACSTSGWAYKVPGRVGDSPIVGHGLYVDPRGGAAVATGNGELVMGICGCFLAVEAMRRGASAAQAAIEVVRRVGESYELEPQHQVAIITLKPDGTWSSASVRGGFHTAVLTDQGRDLLPAAWVMHP